MCAHKVTPTLIVCPVSTVSHWLEEIKQHSLRGTFKVQLHYGNVKLKSPTELDDLYALWCLWSGPLSLNFRPLLVKMLWLLLLMEQLLRNTVTSKIVPRERF